jgi:hypothetical protein
VSAQFALFGDFNDRPGFVSHAHPDTSHAAAADVMPRTGTQRWRVYNFIVRKGDAGATDDEIQRALCMNGNTQRPRRVELVDAGLIVDSGQRRVVRGRLMIVWKRAS